MGLWGVSKVCLVLLFLTLNLLLLFQDFSFLLQERHVNENAVGEDLIVRYEIERKLRKTVKVEMTNELISTFFRMSKNFYFNWSFAQNASRVGGFEESPGLSSDKTMN